MRNTKTNVNLGQGLVEFALTIPILLALILGIVEISRLVYVFVSVNTASREAARYGSAIGVAASGFPRYYDCTGILAAGLRFSTFTGIEADDFTVWYDTGPSGTDLYGNLSTDGCATLATFDGDDDIILGSRINVTTSTDYVPLVTVFVVDIPSFSIKSTASRTLIRDLDIDP